MRLWIPSLVVLSAIATTTAFADSPGGAGGQAPPAHSGAEIYRHVCQACHMADGKGGTGSATVPALYANLHLASLPWTLITVLNGRGGMPWFNGQLTPGEIASVVNYVRTNFGNQYRDKATPEQVKQMAGPIRVDDH
ncbi:cytochrome c precursor [Acetobacter nitrogenifigens DSM 23921 = NBRC 105050]|uniref:Cytochrome c n=1 Tax=Acetobacter nitrogenifigens DSM 23921 = NBRC 105050 TaxID=1120919 RepID=A0A511X8L7_9PROT|nr:cytochrome c [Acetobacter nitrogenifigens]GBQ91932.1 cytochrome c precursor [Acetobacter nitrogenifigens DSM 23921 = NBRC 105050]GEN59278.1 cytochrome c [Acetobacter nitrogenifigens DSM 23921 = NBRC 105050]